MTTSPSPTITIQPETRSVTVFFHDNILASTSEALILREGRYDPVHYIPQKHVAMEFLLATERHTTCPHKGIASYWTISAAGQAAENAVWGYLDPKAGVEAIAGHVAFYPDKVRIQIG